ncbi:unnamed protein product [Effrenium voratum]|uniref:Serine aminopeptidase S33 domain-containing protein n=1 Tax=Effrenium voratum TaxID=2562239 RepID=A0AA36IIS8_9DINO|nr:unnamed protein product [Effrenium voratum]
MSLNLSVCLLSGQVYPVTISEDCLVRDLWRLAETTLSVYLTALLSPSGTSLYAHSRLNAVLSDRDVVHAVAGQSPHVVAHHLGAAFAAVTPSGGMCRSALAAAVVSAALKGGGSCVFALLWCGFRPGVVDKISTGRVLVSKICGLQCMTEAANLLVERSAQLAEKAAARARALIQEDAALQLQSYWRSRQVRQELARRVELACCAEKAAPEIRILCSQSHPSLRDVPAEELRADEPVEVPLGPLPRCPEPHLGRRIGEVRVGAPTCRHWSSRPLGHHEILSNSEEASATGPLIKTAEKFQVNAYPAGRRAWKGQAQMLLPCEEVKLAGVLCRGSLAGAEPLTRGSIAGYLLESPNVKVKVFLHGYSSNGDLYLEFLADLARSGILVLVPDLPCHGRSDGLLLYISDWWAWVEQVWTALELVLPLECIVDGGMLPIFLAGNSLGGGLAACLALQRPSFFRGVILICPMLTISDEVKPPWIVQMTFKHVIAPLFPTLPVTPVKDMADFDFRDPAQGRSYVKASPFSLQGLTPRLGTSMQLGFIFPEWLDEHLSQDRITDPKTSQRLFDEAIAKDKTIKFYDGAYHCELFCCLPGNATFIGIPWTPEQE